MKDVLREHDAKSTKHYDRGTVRQIRISILRGDREEAEMVRQAFEEHAEALPERFAESLDALIPFVGLWPALQRGTFIRLLDLRCPNTVSSPNKRRRK